MPASRNSALPTLRVSFRLLALVLLVGSGACSRSSVPRETQAAATFTNPILPAGPDPWVTQKDGLYYLLVTTNDNITIRKTRALSNAGAAAPVVVWTPPAAGPNCCNIWAPELHFRRGKWYIYYTAGSNKADLSTQRTFVLENAAADPTQGRWLDRGRLFSPQADFWAIDGTLLRYRGTDYFVWSGHPDAVQNRQCLYIARMADPVTLTGPRVQLSQPELQWETNGDPDVNEGPEALVSPRGHVFLTYSASGCWTDDYALGLLALRPGGNPLNPSDWAKSAQPVFRQSPSNGVYGPGHNGFFKSPDGRQDWLIYHANAGGSQGCKELRSPRIQRFGWNTDDTPNFGEPVNLKTPQQRPTGEL
jgi:GH43 family beta-xylosidase